MDEFCRRYRGSNLTRSIRRFRQFETESRDDVLSPWVTWPTVWRGVTDRAHGIRHFGQSLGKVDEEFPPVWRTLARAGVECGFFATLHSYPIPAEHYGFYVPDPFAPEPSSIPRSAESFQSLNLAMSRASARNVSTAIPKAQAARFLVESPRLGVRAKTAADVLAHLFRERVQPWSRVRRRTYQSVIAFDIFFELLRRTKPQFTTFFTNHVASAMHRYWAAAFPGDYAQLGFDADWIRRYGDEIWFAMRRFDVMLGRLVDFVDANPEYLLVVASSMGQNATDGQPVRTQVYLRDVARFMTALGVPQDAWSRRPAMEPQISLYIRPSELEHVIGKLGRLRIAGAEVGVDRTDDGFASLSFGMANVARDEEFVEVEGRRVSFHELGLENTAIEDEAGSTAYHVPSGMLMCLDPASARSPEGRSKVDTTDIAPALLSNFGVPIRAYMSNSGRFDLHA